MYQTKCPDCGDDLFMVRATFVFDIEAVRVDKNTGYTFDGDQVQDAQNEIAECAGCCRTFDLNQELYQEAVFVMVREVT